MATSVKVRGSVMSDKVQLSGMEGSPGNFWQSCATRFSKSRLHFRPKHTIFSHSFSDLASESCNYQFLNRLRCLGKVTILSNYVSPFAEDRHWLFFSFKMHLELKREIRFYAPVFPLKIYARIQAINKLAKPILVFRAKGFRNHTLWGGTYTVPILLMYKALV